MSAAEQPYEPIRFLEGQHVYLRPVNQEDTESYYHLLFHSEMRRLTGTQRHFTKEQIHSYIESKAQDSTTVLLLIAEASSDTLIGDIALQDIDSINRNANLRIAIDAPSHQGKGYGSEAIRLMLEYGFGILNLHRIELNVFTYNDRAMHVYKKLGFKQEGVQREIIFYNHQYHDSILMSMLASEYRALYKGNE
ncbi:GNAT family protein [Paenibacillus sp. UMB4589-SE434]|uniref:GNAT family N-acetyltransferase n=1 Tax=Paenibacillus sp. UMB4589-SE434 TaxID=3046314 RepID=UPI002550A2C8|nr:GNAT family protein [Paenibacillus sp. UMB4589-SE434]MDK8182614.1 GNAT family protein [Paenibacillus sp. UMB4589-SE434]